MKKIHLIFVFTVLYSLSGFGQPSFELIFSILTEDGSSIAKGKENKYIVSAWFCKIKRNSKEIKCNYTLLLKNRRGKNDWSTYSKLDGQYYVGYLNYFDTLNIIIRNRKKQEMKITLVGGFFAGSMRLDSIPFFPGVYEANIREILIKRYGGGIVVEKNSRWRYYLPDKEIVQKMKETTQFYYIITPFEWVIKDEKMNIKYGN